MKTCNAVSKASAAYETAPPKAQSALPDDLVNFDSKPDSAYVRQPVLEGLFACSPATIWRMVQRGALPKPKKLSARITAWRVGDLRKVLAECDK